MTAVPVIITPERVTGFEIRLHKEGAGLKRLGLHTVQINLGRLCNQTCLHCHMEAGPDRREVMTRETALSAVEFAEASGAETIDLTGGAPEMNPSFRWLTDKIVHLGKRVLVRSNLTVFLEPGLQDIPEYLAERHVQIVASMPCYTEENVNAQRGPGVYQKSIDALHRLNDLGYGREGSGLILDLVYNPGGAVLPGPQEELERDYKRELASRFGLEFNRLLTITNQPIGRFATCLNRSGVMASYVARLAETFNPANLPLLMCLRQVSISWDGLLYDCDFNQCLGLSLGEGKPFRVGEIQPKDLVRRLLGRDIRTGNHCYACTAGSGSSCSGTLVCEERTGIIKTGGEAVNIRKGCLSDKQALVELLMFHRMETDVDPSDFYIAEANGKLLGAVRLEWVAADHAYLRPIVVASEERGKGVGRALLEKVSLECSKISAVARGEAVSFYRQLGFIPIERTAVPSVYNHECEICNELTQCGPVAMTWIDRSEGSAEE